MKWRAAVRVDAGEVVDVFDSTATPPTDWEEITRRADGKESAFGGHWWYVEVDDKELPETPV